MFFFCIKAIKLIKIKTLYMDLNMCSIDYFPDYIVKMVLKTIWKQIEKQEKMIDYSDLL
jgi:hypothetical protein